MKVGDYVRLPNGDHGFVLETRDARALVLCDWDTPLPCSVWIAELEDADADAFEPYDAASLRVDAVEAIRAGDDVTRRFARRTLRLLHAWENRPENSMSYTSLWDDRAEAWKAMLEIEPRAHEAGSLPTAIRDLGAKVLRMIDDIGAPSIDYAATTLSTVRTDLQTAAKSIGLDLDGMTTIAAMSLGIAVRAGKTEAQSENVERALTDEGKALDDALRELAEAREQLAEARKTNEGLSAQLQEARQNVEHAFDDERRVREVLSAKTGCSINTTQDMLDAIEAMPGATVPAENPTTTTFTRTYLVDELDLPGGDNAVLDTIEDTSRWSEHHRLVFREPNMPDGMRGKRVTASVRPNSRTNDRGRATRLSSAPSCGKRASSSSNGSPRPSLPQRRPRPLTRCELRRRPRWR